MEELNKEQLKKSFHQEMINLYKNMIKIVKYKPTRLMDYINKFGGYEAAVKYIDTESNIQDFAVLWEKERLDLSVEVLIISDTYRCLFDDDLVAYCDRKLKKYSYAPNKIEKEEENSGYIEKEEKIDLKELLKHKEDYLPKSMLKNYSLYNKAVDISVEQWKENLLDTKIVTPNNLDLILRIYSIGDGVGPKELSEEPGYSSTYPYKEVVMTLAKRIKAKLKVDVPKDENKKVLWWHLLFNGGLKDNTSFEWSLKLPLREAVKQLIEEGKIQQVDTLSHIGQKEIKEVSIHKKESLKDSKDPQDALTAFDKLFESIMAGSSKEQEVKDTPSIEKASKEILPKEISTEKCVVPSAEKVDTEVIPDHASDTMQLDYKERIKKECLDYYGAICDICGFDYGYTYGESYEHYIGVHNVTGVEGDEILPDTDPIKDIIPICHNCHHIIHSKTPPIPVDKMRKMIKA